MKKSYYNFFLERGNKVICYNSVADSLILISNKAYDLFNESLVQLEKIRKLRLKY